MIIMKYVDKTFDFIYFVNCRQVIAGLPVPRMVVPRPLAQEWLNAYNKAPVLMACAAGPFVQLQTFFKNPKSTIDLKQNCCQE